MSGKCAGFELLAKQLKIRFGSRFSISESVRNLHGQGVSHHPSMPPDGVLFAESTDDVTVAGTLCSQYAVPIVAFGSGTSVEGHIGAVRGGLCIDLSRMNRVLRVSTEDLDCTVEAGVTRGQLDMYLRDTGLFFPIDPGADATIGGMVATRASGTNAVRYGTMRENVVALTAVRADGTVFRTGSRARKSSSGYDLTRLLVGSEGTLAIITEVILRLHPRPNDVAAAACAFETVTGAIESVIEIIQNGVPIARVEFLDELSIEAVNRYSGSNRKVAPTLLFEFHGTGLEVRQQVTLVKEIVAEHGGEEFEWAQTPEDRSRLWQSRYNVYFAQQSLRPGAAGWVTDACVPISRLAECIEETKADLHSSNLIAPIVGHVGDGNFHVLLLADPSSRSEMSEAQRLHYRISERAIRMNGTCTGEHGIGIGKLDLLEAEHGGESVMIMRAIKSALDPQGLLNPGKMGS